MNIIRLNTTADGFIKVGNGGNTGGGLFKLTTGYGKEYILDMITE